MGIVTENWLGALKATPVRGGRGAGTAVVRSTDAGRTRELDRLQPQSLGWKPAGQRVLDQIGPGDRALSTCLHPAGETEGLRATTRHSSASVNVNGAHM